ncbi:MAG: hypothetical protein HYW07_00585 [Candidatus Latescibacteria bacterium]|nr:hypothetical protein [Candidatus Latescibacterota bacterium]
MRRFAVVFALGALWALPSSAHQKTFFMPQIPNPDKMVIDGQDDDWGWIDPAFAITPDGLFDVYGGPWPPPKDDWDVIAYVAWSSPPDNALYYFARVTDDSLGLFNDDPQSYWKDDALEIITDSDHSSENFIETEMTTGQQYGIRIKAAPGQSPVHIFNVPQQSILWSTKEPYFIFRWTLDPPDAEPLKQSPGTTVTYTYEVKQWTWDFHDKNGPDGSKRHLFAPDQVFGLTFQFDEAENPEAGASVQGGTSPVDGAWQDNSLGSDFITVATEGATGGSGVTAVESDSWGRIKTYMTR